MTPTFVSNILNILKLGVLLSVDEKKIKRFKKYMILLSSDKYVDKFS